MPFHFTSDALSDAHYKAIGLATVEWACLEWLLGETLARLTQMAPSAANLVTTNLNTNTVINLCNTLLSEQFGEESEPVLEFRKIKSRIAEVQPIRNKITHGQWHPSDEAESARHLDFREGKRIKAVFREIKARDIELLAEEISNIALVMSVFVDTHTPQPSPDKSE